MKMRLILCSMLLLLAACDLETNKTIGPVGLRCGEPIGQETAHSNKAVELIGGFAHVCALLDDDRGKCWGMNDQNQCDLKAARNAQKTIHDISNARFSKLTAGFKFSCGIVKDEPYTGIPFCFGEEGPWLDVPHAPVKDISADDNFVCFIKEDGKMGCVGGELDLLFTVSNNGHTKRIHAEELLKHGIDPVSKQMNQDFSEKKFKSVKVGDKKVCAQGADDGIVYCMGSNIRGGGESYPTEVLDYAGGDPNGTPFILKDGTLTFVGSSFNANPAKNIPDRYKLKYKKILTPQGVMLLTAKGNTYTDGMVMPENTLVTFNDLSEEGVLGAVDVSSSFQRDRFSVFCILKDNKKVKCLSSKGTKTPLIMKLPSEISY